MEKPKCSAILTNRLLSGPRRNFLNSPSPKYHGRGFVDPGGWALALGALTPIQGSRAHGPKGQARPCRASWCSSVPLWNPSWPLWWRFLRNDRRCGSPVCENSGARVPGQARAEPTSFDYFESQSSRPGAAPTPVCENSNRFQKSEMND